MGTEECRHRDHPIKYRFPGADAGHIVGGRHQHNPHHSGAESPAKATNAQLAGFIAIVASFFWASSVIIIKQMLTAGITPEELVFFRFLLLAILALVFIRGYLASLPLAVLLQVLLIGLFGYALLLIILFYGLQGVSPTIVAVFITSGLLLTAIFTWLLIPGTVYTTIELAGLGIIICGLLYAMLCQGETRP